jgi:hypothetical protein
MCYMCDAAVTVTVVVVRVWQIHNFVTPKNVLLYSQSASSSWNYALILVASLHIAVDEGPHVNCEELCFHDQA